MSIITPSTADESLACLDVAVNLPVYVEASGQFRDHARDSAHPRSVVGRAKPKRGKRYQPPRTRWMAPAPYHARARELSPDRGRARERRYTGMSALYGLAPASSSQSWTMLLTKIPRLAW